LILPIVTLILEIIPYGAVCNFARPATDGSIGHFRELYSYFDMIPFGYANFAPMITGILSCFVLLLIVIYCITGRKRVLSLVKNTLSICVVVSLCPLLLGLRFFSIVGTLITISLLGELLLILHLTKTPSNAEKP
jgi:hypothetical protein